MSGKPRPKRSRKPDPGEGVQLDGPAELRSNIRAQKMAKAEERFAAGDMYGVYQAIVVSAAANAPLPTWAREALYRIHAALRDGEIADMNEALG